MEQKIICSKFHIYFKRITILIITVLCLTTIEQWNYYGIGIFGTILLLFNLIATEKRFPDMNWKTLKVTRIIFNFALISLLLYFTGKSANFAFLPFYFYIISMTTYYFGISYGVLTGVASIVLTMLINLTYGFYYLMYQMFLYLCAIVIGDFANKEIARNELQDQEIKKIGLLDKISRAIDKPAKIIKVDRVDESFKTGSIHENDKVYKHNNKITDKLTGLYNYKQFYDRLRFEIDQIKETDSKLFLLMIDIDRFKKFNDEFGHAVGDKVLVEMAKTIRNNIRGMDFAARYGGEEFVVIVINATYETAAVLADQIRYNVKRVTEDIEETKGKGVVITVSIGIACYPNCTNDLANLVDIADFRMYRGKEMGGDRVMV